MKRVVGSVLAAVAVLFGLAALYVYDLVTSVAATPVTDDVWMLEGAGGNVGVLRASEGAVVVDTLSFRHQGERIREQAERLAGVPVQMVVNTHYHTDHTHGNPGFAPGTRVVATERTRDYMLFFDGEYWEGEAAETLPNELFQERRELRLGDKTLQVIHPGRGHTGGDLVVLFAEDRVLHTGDLFFHMRYPNIDLEGGGSIREWIATLDRVLELEFDQVIPGHGPVTDREALRRFQDFLKELWQAGQEAASAGRSLEETLASVELRNDEGYDVIAVPLVFRLDRDFVVTRAWQEATGDVKAVEVPGAGAAEAR